VGHTQEAGYARERAGLGQQPHNAGRFLGLLHRNTPAAE
jgi:hypothetical protein